MTKLFRYRLRIGRGAWLTAGLIVYGLISGAAGAWLQSQHLGSDSAEQVISGQKRIVTSESRRISQLVKTVGPSVVSINVELSGEADESFFETVPLYSAAGTGIIVSKSGYVITNRHVVPTNASRVSLTLSDGTVLKDVSVIGRTKEGDNLDIAILKINDTAGHKLIPASLGDSAVTQVGDNIVAIGNALGEFQNTVTSGIISGYGRSVQAADDSGPGAQYETLVDLIQTDAAINQGNSGGPLVSLNGQVIGINTAIAGDAQSIGFAIPINSVKGLIAHTLETGKFARPYLGVRYISLTPTLKSELNLKHDTGAYIPADSDRQGASVVEGGAADRAGIRQKDVIAAVNNKKVDQRHSLPSLLGVHKPGDKVKLTVLRGEKTLQIDVVLGSL